MMRINNNDMDSLNFELNLEQNKQMIRELEAWKDIQRKKLMYLLFLLDIQSNFIEKYNKAKRILSIRNKKLNKLKMITSGVIGINRIKNATK